MFYEKNELKKEKNGVITQVIKNEVNCVLKKAVEELNEKEVENVFRALIEFVDSEDIELRSIAKNMIKYFVDNELFVFVSAKNKNK